ncbi:hypothetical protein BDM02DRAFT_3113160 [Thelephora ganbajun]|uniref:Uncharacterized protein n=1 Tax=Thelephora ganbajun TaxID=370292 RepID=A0ACB6ZL65_THEGA|nr:hypothetical protein BDM02DRAFT_3113160 [Thelephora ganbajun]
MCWLVRKVVEFELAFQEGDSQMSGWNRVTHPLQTYIITLLLDSNVLARVGPGVIHLVPAGMSHVQRMVPLWAYEFICKLTRQTPTHFHERSIRR